MGVVACVRKRKQYIALLESMPLLVALIVWHTQLRASTYTYYGDSEGSKHCFSKGFSHNAGLNFLVGLYWLRAAAERHRPWFDRVCSADNPTDQLSRRDFGAAEGRGWQQIHPDLTCLWETLVRGLSGLKVLDLECVNSWRRTQWAN